MKHARLGFVLLFLLTATSMAYLPDDADPSRTVSLNGQWKFKLVQPEQKEIQQAFIQSDYDDSGWDTIPVPSNWEMQGFEEPHYSRPANTIGLYRRTFKVPAAWKDQRIIIRFEGVLFGYEFWVNGEYVGCFESAFQPADYEMTKYLKWDGVNSLSVRVYKDFPAAEFDMHDSWALSGIHRNVSMFAMPEAYIEDAHVTTTLKSHRKSAVISGRVEFGHFCLLDYKHKFDGMIPKFDPIRTTVTLNDPDGKLIKTVSQEIPWHTAYEHVDLPDPYDFKWKISKPKTWTAEHPNLYSLTVELYQNGKRLHTIKRKVGIRQITIDDEVLELNHKPIKIRGVCRHETNPDVGKAAHIEHWIKDLELMKAANINTVRTSHYPPAAKFLDLCDEYGMYVICEVPFGGGDAHLFDAGFQGDLLARAENTIRYNKHHPCIIAWTVGNENPAPPSVNRTAQYVKYLDPSRPIMLAGDTWQYSGLKHFIDIMSTHYPSFEELESWGKTRDPRRPVICTEYNHALGHSFGGFHRTWEIIEKYDNLAGGCIWHWEDQGLMRKVNGRKVYDCRKHFESLKGKPTALSGDYWLDDNTILDSHGQYGTDGIVYANRIPQEDYWQTRIVYSPVIIDEKQIAIKPGKQEIEFHVQNRYDFTNLKEVAPTWQLFENNDVIDQGNLKLKIKPHKTKEIELELSLPSDLSQNDYRLRIAVKDYNNRDIYEHIIRLIPDSGPVDLIAMTGPSLQSLDTVFDQSLQPDNKIDSLEGIALTKGKRILPVIRVGREATLAERRTYGRFEGNPIWDDYLLFKGVLLSRKITRTDTTTRIYCLYEYPRIDKPQQKVRVQVVFDLQKNGWIDVYYQLNPIGADGYLLEAGIGFVLPDTATEFRWLGDGPYSSHPDKKELSQRGFYHINVSDLYFDGNRANVDLAVITDEAGNGLALVADQANIHCELTDKGMTVTHNAIVTGLGTKGRLPRPNHPAAKTKDIRGAFRYQIISENQWPDIVKKFTAP